MTVLLRKHIFTVAQDKKIPLPAIHEVANKKSAIFYVREKGLGTCDCGVAKHGWNGIGTISGVRYALEMVVCPNCGDARTVYLMNNAGCTPIRPDQWARGERKFQRSCGDCGKSFAVTAQTWEKLSEQTMHKCKNGKRVDLIADEHRDMKGKYHPKG